MGPGWGGEDLGDLCRTRCPGPRRSAAGPDARGELHHPWSAAHILGQLAFGFLFVGLSEEILFRGLIHTYLSRFWTGVWRWRGIEMPAAGVVAALVFTLAHVGFRPSPIEILRLSPPQLLQALALGLFYSWAYHRTGSLLAPVLTHNFSDGALWLGDYVVIALHQA